MERAYRRYSRTYMLSRKIKSKSALPFLIALLLASCSNDIPMQNLGLDDVYRIPRMKKLQLRPALTGKAYRWTVDGQTVSTDHEYIFLAAREGTYSLRFEIIDENTPYSHEFKVNVMHEEVEYSPYIERVYEYCPAPGQFVNELPPYENGDSADDMIRKAGECISGTNDVMITLGGYGGYVTFGFDHTVVNVPGQNDFRIWGNCFYDMLMPGQASGSAEPGIVMVSFDANCNGIPDDPWYELAGSEFNSPLTTKGYSICYHTPDPDRVPVPDNSASIDDCYYIRWTDNTGAEGYIPKNRFHSQNYFPAWINDNTLTFSGTLLAPNARDLSGNGTYYSLLSYAWGYVDNHPNEFEELNSFDISNAVDADGTPVQLPGADFIRVYTGVNQCCGWLGETSTELSKAADLHI